VTPRNAGGPAADRPQAPATTNTQQGQDYTTRQTKVQTVLTSSPSTSGAAAVDVIMFTTSRTCSGSGCWCHIGATIAWPLSHQDEMARMAREVRAIDIAQGVIL
jgi:hypothetical protein